MNMLVTAKATNIRMLRILQFHPLKTHKIAVPIFSSTLLSWSFMLLTFRESSLNIRCFPLIRRGTHPIIVGAKIQVIVTLCGGVHCTIRLARLSSSWSRKAIGPHFHNWNKAILIHTVVLFSSHAPGLETISQLTFLSQASSTEKGSFGLSTLGHVLFVGK